MGVQSVRISALGPSSDQGHVLSGPRSTTRLLMLQVLSALAAASCARQAPGALSFAWWPHVRCVFVVTQFCLVAPCTVRVCRYTKQWHCQWQYRQLRATSHALCDLKLLGRSKCASFRALALGTRKLVHTVIYFSLFTLGSEIAVAGPFQLCLQGTR